MNTHLYIAENNNVEKNLVLILVSSSLRMLRIMQAHKYFDYLSMLLLVC